MIEKKLSETDYVIRTPDRKRKTRVCHLNLLKPYVVRFRQVQALSPPVKVLPVALTAVLPCYSPQDALVMQDAPVLCARLPNSEVLGELEWRITCPIFLGQIRVTFLS